MDSRPLCRTVLLACVLCIGSTSTASSQDSPSLEQRNKEVVRRYVEDLFNAQQFEMIEQVLAPDLVSHAPDGRQAHGRERLRAWIPALHRAFPDLHLSIEEMVAEGDRVALRLRARGTHREKILSLPASGKVLDMPEWFFFRISDGKIAETWFLRDHALMAEQLKQP